MELVNECECCQWLIKFADGSHLCELCPGETHHNLGCLLVYERKGHLPRCIQNKEEEE